MSVPPAPLLLRSEAPGLRPTHFRGWSLTRRSLGVYLSLVLTVFLLLSASFSRSISPQFISPCGRLVHVGVDGSALTQNAVRLDLPDERSWSEITLSYQLEKGEDLSVVLDRRGDDFAVLRLSRAPAQESAVIVFSDGVIRSKIALPPGIPVSTGGTLHLARRRTGIRASLGELWLADIPAHGGRAEFELALFPPDSAHLFDRVSLGEVLLGDGTFLPRRSDGQVYRSKDFYLPLPESYRSASFLLWFSAVLVLPLLYLAAPRVERLFPYHCAHRRGDLRVWLISQPVLLVLVIATLRLIYRDHFSSSAQRNFRVFTLIPVFSSTVFMIVRDRWLASRPTAENRFPAGALLLPIKYLLVTLLGILLLACTIAATHLSRRPVPPDPDGDRSSPKILCFGGSSTAGYPFPKGWPFTYPSLLQGLLRNQGYSAAAVFNLGLNSASLYHVERDFEYFLDELHPTHAIIYSTSNNLHMSLDELGSHISRIIDLGKPRLDALIFVKEQKYNLVYETAAENEIEEHYRTTDAIGRERGALVVDPLPEFKKHREEFLFADQTCHLTKFGNALLARILAAALTKDGSAGGRE